MRWMVVLVLLGSGGCSVIAADVRAVAEPVTPYGQILSKAEDYQGKMIIIGGYVLEVDAGADESVMIVLQAPLNSFEAPGDSDESEGRVVVVHRGYLDPAIFREGRRVTLAGVVGGVIANTEECPARCVELETRDLHLWEDQADTGWVIFHTFPSPPHAVWPYPTYVSPQPRIYRPRKAPAADEGRRHKP